jgi:hypothetical protein
LTAFVLMPSAPDGILSIFHHPIFSIIMLGLLLWFTAKSPGLGILALLTFGGLYLERNRRVLSFAYGTAPRMPEDRHFPVSPSLRFVQYEKPTVSRLPFEPASGCNANSNEWSAVGPTINEKRVLSTVPPGAATWPVLAKEFAN